MATNGPKDLGEHDELLPDGDLEVVVPYRVRVETGDDFEFAPEAENEELYIPVNDFLGRVNALLGKEQERQLTPELRLKPGEGGFHVLFCDSSDGHRVSFYLSSDPAQFESTAATWQPEHQGRVMALLNEALYREE